MPSYYQPSSLGLRSDEAESNAFSTYCTQDDFDVMRKKEWKMLEAQEGTCQNLDKDNLPILGFEI